MEPPIINARTGHTKIFVQHEPFAGNRLLFQLAQVYDRRYFRAKPLTLEEVTAENEHERCEPTFTIDEGTAQELLDRLYAIGLRPSQEVNERSALPFLSAHLADMRKLVFETPQGRVEVREDATLTPEMVRFMGKLKDLDDRSRTTLRTEDTP